MSMVLLTLLRTKFVQYLGRVRRSKLSLFSLLAIYLSWMGIISFSSLFLRLSGGILGVPVNEYVETLIVLIVSSILAIGAFLGSKGGITALGYELDYVLTSRVAPATFLISDLVFQLVLLNIFIVPSSLIIIITISYPGQLVNPVVLLAVYELSIVMSSMTAHLLGVARHWLGEMRAKAIGWGITLLMALPMIVRIIGVQPMFLKAIHPSYLLGLLVDGRADPQAIFLLTLYLAFLVSAYVKAAKTNFYASVTPVLLSALMEPPKKLPRYLRLPILSDALFSIRPGDRPSIMMFKLHLTRIVRDGSLWTAILILMIFTAANMALPRLLRIESFPEVAQLTLVALYTPLFPALLSINWCVSERQNLWIVDTTASGRKNYLSGLFYAYFMVTVVFSSCLYGFVSIGAREVPFLEIDIALLLAMSIFSVLFSIFTSFRLRRAPTPFSISSLLYVLIPMLGSILLSLPILVVRLFEPLASDPTPQLLANISIFIAIVSIVFYRVLMRSLSRGLPDTMGV